MVRITANVPCGVLAWLVVSALLAGGCASDGPAERSVSGSVLTSSALPAISIRAGSGFRYLGAVPFRIGSIATGERHVFVDVKDGSVSRMLIAQFEAILPTSDEENRYSFDGAEIMAGHAFRSNPFAFSHADASADNPAGEAALTAAFIRDAGLRLDDEVMTYRFLTVPDRARKHELIIFYAEPIAPTGHRLSDFYAGDEPTGLWRFISTGLEQRARSAFELSPIDEAGLT